MGPAAAAAAATGHRCLPHFCELALLLPMPRPLSLSLSLSVAHSLHALSLTAVDAAAGLDPRLPCKMASLHCGRQRLTEPLRPF